MFCRVRYDLTSVGEVMTVNGFDADQTPSQRCFDRDCPAIFCVPPWSFAKEHWIPTVRVYEVRSRPVSDGRSTRAGGDHFLTKPTKNYRQRILVAVIEGSEGLTSTPHFLVQMGECVKRVDPPV